MAVTIDDLNVVISSNAAEFRRELKAMNAELKNVGSITKGVSAKTAAWTVSLQAAMKGLQLVGKAVGAIGRAMGKFIGEAVESGSSLTRLSIATSTVAGNIGMTADEVKRLREELADANTYGTVAENVIRTLAMSGLTQMADKLSVVDARTGELVTGTTALVLQMKDLAAAAGIASSEGINKITKFINKGTAQDAEDVGIQIGNMGTEYRMFAKSIGKSRSDLTAQEEAFVRMTIVTREADKAWGAYANTNATANKAMKSFGEVIRFLKEFIGSAFEPVLGAISRAMLEFANSVRRFLFDNEDAIRAWAANVAGYVIAFIRLIGWALSRLPVIGQYFQGLADFAARPIDSLKGLGESADGAGSAIGDTADETARLNKELKGLAGFDEMNVLNDDTGEADKMGGGLFSGMDGAGASVDMGLTSVFNDAVNKANEMADNLRPIFEDIQKKAGIIWSDFKMAWEQWVQPAIDNMKENFQKLREQLGMTGDKAGGAGKKFERFRNILLLIPLAITNVVWFISGFIYTMTQIVMVAKDVALHVWNTFKWLWTAIKMVVEVIWGGVKYTFTQIYNVGSSIVNWLWTTLGGAIRGVIDWFRRLPSEVGRMVNNIRNRIQSLRNLFANFGTRIVIAIKIPINSIIDRINSFLRTLRNIKIPVIAPSGLYIPTIPRLARGGIVESSTIAQIGENGREAIVPLENNTEWMDKIADKINGSGGGLGDGNLIIKIGDETIYERAIQYIKDKSLRTGNNLLNI